jgi:hypothetical protein
MVEVALIPVLIVLFPSEADATLWSASRRRHSFSASTTGKGGERQRDGGMVDVLSVFTSKVC